VTTLVATDRVRRAILTIRGKKVMIDADLAELYGVETRVLNQAVRRNRDRFPDEFMFRLSGGEKQAVITKCDHLRRLKFSPTLPYVFTEHGALMLSSVLNSPVAVEVSLQIVRVFIRLRQAIQSSHKELRRRLATLEQKYDAQDTQIQEIFAAVRALMAPPGGPKRQIGFRPLPDEDAR
jgi:ORF6N domain